MFPFFFALTYQRESGILQPIRASERKGFHLQENTPLHEDQASDSSESWLAAISYLPIICLIPYFFHGTRPYVAYHARQGLLLFLLELAGLLTYWTVKLTFGRIPFLGNVVMFLLLLAILLPVVALIILGFAKALTGEKGPLPWIGHWADKIPPAPSGD